MLGPAGSAPPIRNSPEPRPNPLVELPEPGERVVDWAEAVLVTHLHADHLDDAAVALIDGRLPVLCQPEDEATLHERGLTQARAVADRLARDGLTVHRTGGQHGTGEIGAAMAPVSGFVVAAEGSPSVYVAGDTIWCPEVEDALARLRPDVVVVNAGGARFLEGDPITMTPQDVLAVMAAAPWATVIAVHMEAINHCLVTRRDLAGAVAGVVIPADGETVPLG
jgi:L-ascorbate metabolism protein UlaG (beta-lactamase superfamily)